MGWTTPTTWTTGVPTAAAFNQQIRDNLNAVGDHEAWAAYTPALTGSVANPNPSAASGHYIQVGNVVFYAWRVVSGSTVGSGNYSVSLPVNGNFGNNRRAGAGALVQGAAYPLCHYSTSTSAGTVQLMWNAKTASGVVTAASPITVTNGSRLLGWMIYRAAT